MKPEGPFVAERLAAQHCQELLRGPRKEADPLEALPSFGARLAGLLEHDLPALFAGARLAVTVGEPEKLQPGSPADKPSEPLVCSQLLAGPREMGMAACVSSRAVFSIVDRVFGGGGNEDEAGEGKLPLSILLTWNRIARLLAKTIAAALELSGDDAVKIVDAPAGPKGLAPYAGSNRAVLPLRMAVDDAQPWELQLIIPSATLEALFAGKASAKPADGQVAPPPADPLSGPIARIPLQLTAVLVDMEVPVALLSKLKPGAVLPVSVARNVPLYAGERVLAHGTVGAADDRAALKLTQIIPDKEN